MMSCYCVIVVMFIVVMLYFLSLHYLYQPALVFCQLSNNSLRAYYLLLEAAIAGYKEEVALTIHTVQLSSVKCTW